jgi:hypothetical protein
MRVHRRAEIGKVLAGWAVALVIVLLLLEPVLRLAPSLIPISVLHRFTPSLRQEVAERLNLPTTRTRPVILAAQRSDGGPDIYLLTPDRNVNRADREDLAVGAIEEIASDPDGFCNLPERAARPRADVIFIGDSFTWCVGVGPMKSAAAAFEDKTGLTALDLGVPGIGPWEYLEVFRRYGTKRQPRIVVLNIYEGNDLRDIRRFDEFRATGRQRKREAIGGPFAWSYALAFTKAAIEEQIRKLRDRNRRDDFRYTVQAEGRTIAMNVGNADQDELASAYGMAAGRLDPSLYEGPLNAFAEMARAEGFRPVLAYIPSAYTAYSSSVRFSDEKSGRAVREMSWRQRAWLAANAPRLGLQFIDLVPAFEAVAAAGALTHFPANLHLTPAGHKVLAEAVAAALPVQDVAAAPAN